MTVRVVIGTILIAVTMIISAFVLVNEPARMQGFAEGYNGRSIEAGAAIFSVNCAPCHGVTGQGIDGVAPALNAKDLLDDTKGTPRRLKEIGWAGTVRDYITAAVSSGRPRASAIFSSYPNRMPTWSQQFGGPLRPDQINYVVDFVMNWKADVVKLPDATPTPNPNAVGADLDVKLPAGDPKHGDDLFKGKGPNGQYPCSACHSLVAGQTLVGPSLAGVATSAATRKPNYDAARYIHESIVSPSAYVVQGFNNGIMPQTFAQTMTKQDLADILAFLLTQK
jgi:cytochrome c2